MTINSDSVELAKKIVDQDRMVGIPTGFKNLDELIGGIKRGSLVIFAGATNMGKSLFTLQLSVNLCKSGHKLTYFDLENGDALTWERLIRIWYDIPADYFLPENSLEIAQKTEQIQNKGFNCWTHDDLYQWTKGEGEESSNLPLKDLITEIIRKKKNSGHTFFIIDPLQALESDLTSHDLFQQQSKIVQDLKELAQDLGIVIIMCHHMRKGGSSDRGVTAIDKVKRVSYRLPSLDDLRGSGKISDFATDVWGMLRITSGSTKAERSKTLIRVLKNRTGKTGDVILYFHEKNLGFSDRPELEYQDGEMVIS